MTRILIALCALAWAGLAQAQGYLNPPTYSPGIVWVQPGTTVTTNVVNARTPPTNLYVLAYGAITTWTVNLPAPTYDGQSITVGCPVATATTLTIATTDGSTITGAPTSCIGGPGVMYQFQYSQVYNSWALISGPASPQGPLPDTPILDINPVDLGANPVTYAYDDGVVAAGSNVFCSAKANFPPTVVGQLFNMDYVGPGTDAIGAGGNPFTTTVTGWTSPHCLTLGANATQLSGWSFTSWFVPDQTGVTATYNINSTICVSGGTLVAGAPAACGTVIATQPISITVASAGTGGYTSSGSNSGACQLQGTTGTSNYRFVVQIELASGSLSTVDAITFPGVYTGDLTTPSAESVVPINGCTGLTGATVSVVMAPEVISPVTRGKYLVLPSANSATTVSGGGGSGLTMTLNATPVGAYTIGTDSGPAIDAAVAISEAIAAAGSRATIKFPPGNFITATPPRLSVHSACISGAGKNRTWLQLLPAYNGDAFSWSDAWNAPNGVEYLNPIGGIGPFSLLNISPCIKNITIAGDRESPYYQNGAMFYDRTDHAIVEGNFFVGFNGHCFAFGLEKLRTSAYVRDTVDILDNECWNSGTGTAYAAVLFDIQGTGAASEDVITNLHIFGPFGDGLVITDDTTGSFRDVRMVHVRIEGIPHHPVAGLSGDLLRIGSATNAAGQLFNITCIDCEWTNSFLGWHAITITHNGKTLAPHNIRLVGDIIGADNFGGGVNLVSVRSSYFQFGSMSPQGPYVTISDLLGSDNEVRGVAGEDQGWPVVGPSYIGSATTVTAGTGNLLGNLLTLGGSGLVCDQPPVVKVTQASPLQVSTNPPGNPGLCSATGTNPVGVVATTGSGIGATFNLSWNSLASVAAINNWDFQSYVAFTSVNSAGSGYALGDLLTIGPSANYGMVCQILPIMHVDVASPLAVSVANPGLCTNPGSGPYAISTHTGSGTSATLNLTWAPNP